MLALAGEGRRAKNGNGKARKSEGRVEKRGE
jgi:hypothetical protein